MVTKNFKRTIRIRIKANELYFGTGKAGGVITRNHRAESLRSNVAKSDLFAVGSVTKALLPPTTLTGWLENGCQRVMLAAGLSPCASVTAKMVGAVTNGREKHDKDLKAGYHDKGACIEKGESCIIAETFGTMQHPGALLRNSFVVHAMRGNAIDAAIEGNGGFGMFRITHIAPRSKEDQLPYLPIELERIAFVDGCWEMTVRPWVSDDKAMIILGMLIKAIELLHNTRDSYNIQMGGRRNLGAGIVSCEIMNPLYDLVADNKAVAYRVFQSEIDDDEPEEMTLEQKEKEEAILSAKDEDLGVAKKKQKASGKLEKKMREWDAEWEPIKKSLVKAFEDYVEKNKAKFGIAEWQKK